MVAAPCYMGAPMIIIERLFSGRESVSAMEAAAVIAFSGDQLQDKDAGDGIREADNIQELLKAEVVIFNSHTADRLAQFVLSQVR